MTTREQAINSTELLLQYVLTGQGASIPIGCQFVDADYLAGGLYNALELLKEQEPQPAIIEGSDVICIGRCPSCKTVLQPWGANYCHKCGQAVKWDE